MVYLYLFPWWLDAVILFDTFDTIKECRAVEQSISTDFHYREFRTDCIYFEKPLVKG